MPAVRSLLAFALLLAAPASASAAPFGELPFRPVESGATCLRATGVPGELVRWTRGGVELLAARSDGLTTIGTLAVGTPSQCPAVAGHANGAAVLAAPSEDGVRVVLREPGGTWGAPATIPANDPYAAEAAINARGDAVVLFGEITEKATRLRGARRPAGGLFGPAETLAGDTVIGAAAAVTGSGEAFVLVSGDDVRLTSAPSGAPFPPGRRLLGGFAREGAIAATTDGRVLIAVGAMEGLTVFEREPGGDLARRPLIRVADSDDAGILLRDDGAAVVTWGAQTSVGAMVRSGPGAFGPPASFAEPAAPRPDRDRSLGVGLFATDPGDPPLEGYSRPRAVFGPDGSALLAWGIADAGVRVATITASGPPEREALGSSVRDQGGITPLLLADGRRAVAWTDNAALFSVPPYVGRLHLALEGAPTVAAPAPELEVLAPRDRTLRPGQTLLLPVRCSAACDLRGTLDDDANYDPGISLDRPGTALLRFRPSNIPVAPRRPGPVRVVVRWSAPGSSTVRSVTENVRLRRLPAPRLPRILDVRARRLSGGRVEVRWRTDGPTIDALWYVYGSRVADLKREKDYVSFAVAPAGDRRSHRVVLKDSRRARHALVTLNARFGSRSRKVSVPIS
jgi:hypothetical protein